MSHRTEFPDFDPSTLPDMMPPGFEDLSWRKDMCPQFFNEGLGLAIWVDYADPDMREFPDTPRYSVNRMLNGVEASEDLIQTDDWLDVLRLVADEWSAMLRGKCRERTGGTP